MGKWVWNFITSKCTFDRMINAITTHMGVTWRWWRHQSSVLLGPCVGNPPVIVGFSAQRVSKANSVSMSWHHHSLMDRSSSYVGLSPASFLFIEKEKWVIKTDQSWCKVVMAPVVVMYQWYHSRCIYSNGFIWAPFDSLRNQLNNYIVSRLVYVNIWYLIYLTFQGEVNFCFTYHRLILPAYLAHSFRHAAGASYTRFPLCRGLLWSNNGWFTHILRDNFTGKVSYDIYGVIEATLKIMYK